MSERGDLAARIITVLRSGHEDFARLVTGMTDEDLTRQSAASKWTVAQVLSHLGSGAEIVRGMVEQALGATPEPEAREKVWARWNGMTAQEQAARVIPANEALLSRLESLDRDELEKLRVDFGFLPEPADAARAAALRLSEWTYHVWDVAVVFDPAATLAPDAVEFLFEPITILIGFIGKPDALDGKRLTLAVHATRPERSFGLDLGESIGIADLPEPATDVLRIPSEALLRLFAGRLAPEHTPADVRLSSDTLTLDDLRRTFPGF